MHVYNLGTGKGYSVLEMAKAMRDASGKEIELEFVDRRAGTFITLNHASHDYKLITPPPTHIQATLPPATPTRSRPRRSWAGARRSS